jgi:hypothetical protein
MAFPPPFYKLVSSSKSYPLSSIFGENYQVVDSSKSYPQISLLVVTILLID